MKEERTHYHSPLTLVNEYMNGHSVCCQICPHTAFYPGFQKQTFFQTSVFTTAVE